MSGLRVCLPVWLVHSCLGGLRKKRAGGNGGGWCLSSFHTQSGGLWRAECRGQTGVRCVCTQGGPSGLGRCTLVRDGRGLRQREQGLLGEVGGRAECRLTSGSGSNQRPEGGGQTWVRCVQTQGRPSGIVSSLQDTVVCRQTSCEEGAENGWIRITS